MSSNHDVSDHISEYSPGLSDMASDGLPDELSDAASDRASELLGNQAGEGENNNIVLHRDGSIAELIIDRPSMHNSLTPKMIETIVDAINSCESDSSSVSVIIISGSGERSFCTGYDVGELVSGGSENAGVERERVDVLTEKIRSSSLPFVAAVNGDAIGAGCDLALACDLRVCHDGVRFGMPPVRLGVLSGWGGVQRMMQIAGRGNASELLLLGRPISAMRAYEMGLVNFIAPQSAVMEEARRLAGIIAANAPLSVSGTKRIMNILSQDSISEAGKEEIRDIHSRVWKSDDAAEGPLAFREKRKPVFKGR
ncbi:MAG: enoyl-CoA hydratase/isomerase family protein [Actinobacteria bacterium]|nr:enoyl-CoA hydratase/isomerase family protein [Actinomycetota bacterium]